MRKVAPAREWALAYDVKPSGIEKRAPFGFATKRARSGAFPPLEIVRPTDQTVPPDRGNVFINNSLTARAQDPLQLIHDCAEVLAVMQYVAEEYRVH